MNSEPDPSTSRDEGAGQNADSDQAPAKGDKIESADQIFLKGAEEPLNAQQAQRLAKARFYWVLSRM